MRGSHWKITAVALAFVAVALAGCSGGDGGSKAGGAGGPLTLRIGTHDIRTTPGGAQIEEFARRVEDLSGGEVQIEPVWRAAGEHIEDWDQQVARLVTSGELDLGLIPSRAWDTEGVTSLRALNAPFLITSDELLAETVSSELASDMLAGLDEAGVVGLALFPEGLRHPFGFRAPLLGPSDYAGATIRAPTSNTTAALFAALGAGTNDDQPLTQAGMESSYLLNPTGTAAGNVTFYPKANALVVNDAVIDDLDQGQRAILEQAAAETRDWAIETIPDDAEAARMFCEEGGVVVLASDADRDALEEAAASVYAELEQDPQTKSLIEQIRALESEVTTSARAEPAACDGSDDGAGTATNGDDTESTDVAFPEGVYRTELPYEFLVAQGLTEEEARDIQGIGTLTFEAGRWAHETENDQGEVTCEGPYTTEGKRIVVTFGGTVNLCGLEGTVLFSAEWTLADGELRFLEVHGEQDTELFAGVVWGGKPWEKIG